MTKTVDQIVAGIPRHQRDTLDHALAKIPRRGYSLRSGLDAVLARTGGRRASDAWSKSELEEMAREYVKQGWSRRDTQRDLTREHTPAEMKIIMAEFDRVSGGTRDATGNFMFKRGDAVEMVGSGKIGDVVESDEDMTLVEWRDGKESRVDTDKLKKFTSSRDCVLRLDAALAAIPDRRRGARAGDALRRRLGLVRDVLTPAEQKRLEDLRVAEMRRRLSSKEQDELTDLINKNRARKDAALRAVPDRRRVVAHGLVQDFDWSDWLANKLGTHKWVVAPRLTEKLREKYDVAISQQRYNELAQQYKQETGNTHYP